MGSSDMWAGAGAALGSLLVLFSMAKNHVKVTLWLNKIAGYFNPYIQITIPEYGAERFQRSDFFVAIEAYLSDTCAHGARKLKADLGSDRMKPQASVDDGQEIVDTYRDVTLWWYAYKEAPSHSVISFGPSDEDRRFYRVTFHSRFRDLVLREYVPYVLDTGRAVTVQNRQRRLFTNNTSRNRSSSGKKAFWSHVEFKHPARFETLAMDPTEKQNIIDDLVAFKEGKDYYEKVGKPWKRGYLLFGPPGTGKSTMIAAIANFLDYDVYDLELTAVENNTDLRKLFIETTGKSIIVIEDIDCSVDLVGKRKVSKGPQESGSGCEGAMDKMLPKEANKDDKEGTKMTLSGMLNVIDGLWSACGGERIIIFTTNNKDKLDPALIRRGRMDKHIEMTYCRYEAFKVLASNYLDITDHNLFEQFGEIQELLGEIDMSPADVAENLMPMSRNKRDAGACLASLVVALRKAKAKMKEEAKAIEKEEISTEAVEAKREADEIETKCN